jgi:hypothetical protein
LLIQTSLGRFGGTDRFWLCGIGGESGSEQTNGQAATDAMDPARRASAVTDSHAGAEWVLGINGTENRVKLTRVLQIR